MKRFFVMLFFACMSISFRSHAVTIELTSSSYQVDLGSTLELRVNVAGLDNSPSQSLGDYDIDLHYDALLFSVSHVIWGDSLSGNQLDINGFGSLQTSSTPSTGLLNVVELSFDSAADLDMRQAPAFRLFSVVFSALGDGVGIFSLSNNAFGDAYGNPIVVDTINSSATVNVSKVPEPSGLLIVVGLLLIGLSCVIRKYCA